MTGLKSFLPFATPFYYPGQCISLLLTLRVDSTDALTLFEIQNSAFNLRQSSP
jgi:hypothetical protein